MSKKTKATTIWLTGLPCSGKTTIAKRLKRELSLRKWNIIHLDGDDVRKTLSADLGFSQAERQENLRRVAHVAQLLNDKGISVIASFISPTESSRAVIRAIIKNLRIFYIKCGIKECQRRDTKGMYRKARMGKISDFTGISSPFETPAHSDLVIDSGRLDITHCVDLALKEITRSARQSGITH